MDEKRVYGAPVERPKIKKRWRDRYDGRRLMHTDTFFTLIPHIMTTRNDSEVGASFKIDVTPVERYLRKRRTEGSPIGQDLTFIDVVMAAIVRMISQRPYVNRFIAGRKAYSRDELSISLAIKKNLSVEGTQTVVKMVYDPHDTIFDVALRLQHEIERNKDLMTNNSTDSFAKFVNHLPTLLIRMVIGTIKWLDFHGWMPKTIQRLSPFHCSIFVTAMGSINFPPIYHHIYNFGTCSGFIAYGPKYSERVLAKDGSVVERKYIDFKIVGDERICDGFGMASAWKELLRYIKHPELLEEPPETVKEDSGI
ncbi:hypothetical protein [Pleomorphochaeta sp. DL1XJH-081]|uniref:hypothetical protein n=1 Tax=Pleomorphochaeta sp. DL1XJH-081 TaxID=3409690 RepID=UPI003BB6C42E